jgi:hypothetical protein
MFGASGGGDDPRSDFLARLKGEREQEADKQRRLHGAIVIQSHVRAYLARARTRRTMLDAFDTVIGNGGISELPIGACVRSCSPVLCSRHRISCVPSLCVRLSNET